ncbi:TKL protein kinase [Phytophthora nicotianae CJ01A1]|uniref:TKL protein kinase n=4 Tax=Phytophthora nicotianae TaxID=4792 RepID=W2RHN8_PHYN3|nr:TKL protein kinase [Phytophthora nicotianae INRA-310]ETI56904.1 TKL protein kinase [Phytophthora nicotianae P1569]ETK96674.1 TKL protein kinase [Phytophthora nicotianae]ETP26679.1 TKL protein kinase [Phytophthora nicotianae CJ01A1]KUF76355.1 tyrosine-protein kinase [Phytophthora nicotianae]ETL50033.1 TKL protein kinase [Phytophthora nicotianae]
MMRIVLRSITAALLLAASTHAACETKGTVVLMATGDDSEALVVDADCEQTEVDVSTSKDTPTLTASSMNIQKVLSAPDVETIDLSLNNITSVAVSNLTTLEKLTLTSNAVTSFSKLAVPDTLKQLDLSWNDISSFDGMALPDTMTQLFLGGNPISSVSGVTFPSALTLLYIHNLKLTTLEGATFPDSIQMLSLVQSGLSSLDGVNFPDSLQYIDFSFNTITSLPTGFPSTVVQITATNNEITQLNKYSFPSSISQLNFSGNPIESIRGVSFPMALSKLDFGSNEITNFEISRSDYSTFKDLDVFNAVVAQTSCSTSGAELVAVSGYSICVISDELFESTYGNSSSSSSAESTVATPVASSNSNSTILIVVICLAAVLAVALAAFAYRTYRVRQTEKDVSGRMDDNNFFANNTLMDTATNSGGQHISNNNKPHNSNSDSFNTIFSGGKVTMMGGTAIESALVKYRVPANEVHIERSIAKGGFGIVYLANYQNRPVVVKKILPEKAADDRCLSAFIEEIKLISSLSHAKIVRFIGVSWSMLSDMAVLMEYMPNGDLDMLLKQQHERQEMYPKEFDWYQNSSVLPAKASIALDVLEAIVYLHSFPSPIIHRDLKSKNVLLSASYEAKLSDFGVSREWQVDTTMTAGIGTMAWIAPEVLRGERYTEMADIYSFGVILSELATCIKPFDGVTNALIVLKVTSEEKPDLGQNCPEDIRELADRCLSFNANDRPSASVAHYELRTLLKLHSAFEL